tara:strand:- start:516 stop:1223 length:708 start_codon:yes stop_codon:yes gene_type:complete
MNNYFFSDIIEGGIITLDKAESNHCIKVLRKLNGDKINVVDGTGKLYVGKIINDDKFQCQVEIEEIIEKNKNKENYIHVAISPTKNHDRIDWFIEKAVEIGVDEISFIKCERTLRKKIKINRLTRIAITAIKQSLKAQLPKLNDIVTFNEFLNKNQNNIGYICHLEEGNRTNLFSLGLKEKKNFILIGPEGDFSSNEIKLARSNNIRSISLGESRLRTETAGVVACHLLNLKNNG